MKGRPPRSPGSPRDPSPSRCSGEQGFVGGFEGLLFGVLIFVVGTLLVAHAWAVVDTKFAVVEAAKQAARTYVEAQSAAVAGPEAEQAADQALAGYGRDRRLAGVSLVSGSLEAVTVLLGANRQSAGVAGGEARPPTRDPSGTLGRERFGRRRDRPPASSSRGC